MVGCWVKSVREKTAKISTLRISMSSVSSFKPSGRSGKMRALSFKTGIACLCGTEVKEKLQCECNSSICSDAGGGGECCRNGRRETRKYAEFLSLDSAEEYSHHLVMFSVPLCIF